MAKKIDAAALTVLAAGETDLSFARSVAAVLQQRGCGGVKVALFRDLQAMPTHLLLTSSAAMDLILRQLAAAGILYTRTMLNGLAVLIHAQPVAEHFEWALRNGFDDVIAWPQELPRILKLLSTRETAPPCLADGLDMQLLGNSPIMVHLRERIDRVAAHDCNVLLVGETGTGKERVAQAIHQSGKRRTRPMISINCAALPEALIESELFGHERGAFTGAHNSSVGKFALAEGGVLFLDEIGDMPLAAQAKILRVLESREYFRVGGTHSIKSDVRLIAATHHDLQQSCNDGTFRPDLYFRLNVARIDLPPLRDRCGDILNLAEFFLTDYGRNHEHKRVALQVGVRSILQTYPWPGNVRELRNAMESALINSDNGLIGHEDLPGHILHWAASTAPVLHEKDQLVSTLQRNLWNKSKTARELQWSRMKLYRKLQQYGLGEQDGSGWWVSNISE